MYLHKFVGGPKDGQEVMSTVAFHEATERDGSHYETTSDVHSAEDGHIVITLHYKGKEENGKRLKVGERKPDKLDLWCDKVLAALAEDVPPDQRIGVLEQCIDYLRTEDASNNPQE
jgi:hypothetical protein